MEGQARDVAIPPVVGGKDLERGQDLVGRLRPGMRADIVVWEASTAAELAYWIGGPMARRVLLAGRPVVLSD